MMRKVFVVLALLAVVSPAMAAKDLTAVSEAFRDGAGASAATRGPAIFSTGFEQSGGFMNPGLSMNGQGAPPEGPWSTRTHGGIPDTMPILDNLFPYAGAQHVTSADDQAVPPGAFPNTIAFSPDFGPQPVPTSDLSVSAQVLITNSGGADYGLFAQAPSLGSQTIQVRFYYADADGDTLPGELLVLTDTNGPAAGGVTYAVTGVEYDQTLTYQEVRAVLHPGTHMIDYYYAGVFIGSASGLYDAGGNPVNRIEQVLFGDDQYQLPGEAAFWDDVNVTPEPGSLALLLLGAAAALRRYR
jgi:hypothetical protein